MAVSPAGIAYVTAGTLILWSGFKGASIADTVKSALKGTLNPPVTEPVNWASGGNSGSSGGSNTTGSVVTGSGSAQAVMQQTAAQFGWGSGTEWQALSSLEMQEAGFNPHAKNPSSGAYGLAQSLGHPGTPGSESAEYGGYGLTPAEEKAANSGDPRPQALWMMRYIQSVYGDPVKAWAHEQSHNWY